MLDTFKQIVGQVTIHFINLYISIYFNARTSRIPTAGVKTDECTWYFTTFLIDLFPGLLMIYLISSMSEKIFLKLNLRTLLAGNYAEDHDGILFIRKGAYMVQIVVWVITLLLSKLIVFAMQIPLERYLGALGSFCLSIFDFSKDLKLFFVMILFPLVANVLAFWISDNLLKKKIWFENEQSLKKSFFEPDQTEMMTTLMHLNVNKTNLIRTSVLRKNY
jgi:hypothetical protein